MFMITKLELANDKDNRIKDFNKLLGYVFCLNWWLKKLQLIKEIFL